MLGFDPVLMISQWFKLQQSVASRKGEKDKQKKESGRGSPTHSMVILDILLEQVRNAKIIIFKRCPYQTKFLKISKSLAGEK